MSDELRFTAQKIAILILASADYSRRLSSSYSYPSRASIVSHTGVANATDGRLDSEDFGTVMFSVAKLGRAAGP